MTAPGTALAPVLRVSELSKAYNGVFALRDVDLDVRPGEVHALLGGNGSGKSTLIKVLAGVVPAEPGAVLALGDKTVDLAGWNSDKAYAAGLRFVHQQPAVFSNMSIAENIAFGTRFPTRAGGINWKQLNARTAELLDRFGVAATPTTPLGALRAADRTRVAIIRAVQDREDADSGVLVLDEPTAALPATEVEHLLDSLRRYAEAGQTILYVSHRLDEVLSVADRVTVLRDGETIDTRPMAEVTREELIQLMVGRELSAIFPKQEVEIGATVLELQGVGSSAAGIRDVSLTVRAGEIVGLAGLVGAGRTELARTLFGLTPAEEGEILIRGEAVTIDSPSRAIAHGIGYVPEDRRRHGVVLEMPVSSNVTLAALDELTRRGSLDFAREKELAATYSERMGVKTPSIYTPVSSLSGGNQQKVALSRWLIMKPSLLILDEPTQGIDVGAKSEIHRLMSQLAAQGMAILMISSELPEILGMSDRVVVMHGGTMAGTLSRAEATQEGILKLALGGHQD